jgi:hypothetical protein
MVKNSIIIKRYFRRKKDTGWVWDLDPKPLEKGLKKGVGKDKHKHYEPENILHLNI